jgi:hypothetical protein
MTITTITNAANLGTTTSLSGQSITKTTLQAGTTGVIVNVKLVQGPEAQNQSQMVRVFYAILPFNLTADATLPPTLNPTVGLLEIKCSRMGGGTVIDTTGLVGNNGGFLYTWFESPALSPSGGAAGTITITSVELP